MTEENTQLEDNPQKQPSLKDIYKLTPVFANFTLEDIEEVERIIQTKLYPSGETVFREGENCKYLYVIGNGKVEVTRKGRKGAEVKIAELKKGDIFGENSLLDQEMSSATGVAVEDTLIFALPRLQLQILYHNALSVWAKLNYNVARLISFRFRTLLKHFTTIQTEIGVLDEQISNIQAKPNSMVQRLVDRLSPPLVSIESLLRILSAIKEKERLLY